MSMSEKFAVIMISLKKRKAINLVIGGVLA